MKTRLIIALCALACAVGCGERKSVKQQIDPKLERITRLVHAVMGNLQNIPDYLMDGEHRRAYLSCKVSLEQLSSADDILDEIERIVKRSHFSKERKELMYTHIESQRENIEDMRELVYENLERLE